MREQEIYIEAMNRHEPADRRRFLDEACGDNRALRERLDVLIRHSEEVASFLESPAAEHFAAPTLDQLPLEKPGTQIGPYKLLQQIGEGGFGVVYMAEQTAPVQRRVALKIIKPGMDTRQVFARFEAEEQALAMMDHPHIARVFDAGVTDSGRPYFVMELVNGIPITRFCDEQHLTARERLELFIPVCQAVQHAHQKGIIHRDIKPSNILVALYDDRPVPKVIDFGVAKATGAALTERTMFTGLGQIIGTLEYMSPEQAQRNQLDVDTRSDIYSLGAVLYELLTGDTPFDRQRLRSAALDELLRIIREEVPPRPSAKLSHSDTLPSVAANRRIEPAKLSTLVRGELDWIVMKALEKDRARRYETANGFANDIERYLTDEPVLACPPSAAYLLRKFVRRNRGLVLAVTLVLLALAAGFVGTTWGVVRAERARRAEAQRAEGERQARQEAEAREAETQAVLDFVEKRIFAAARPERIREGLGYNVRLQKVLEAALPYVETSFRNQPLIEARLRLILGQLFGDLGETKTALRQFQTARALYHQHRGPEHADTLTCVYHLANTDFALGQYVEAAKLHEETLARRKATLGLHHRDTLTSMKGLADTYTKLGRDSEAHKLQEEALALRKATLGPDDADTLDSLNGLANCYSRTEQLGEALKLYEEAAARMKVTLGLEHLYTLGTMHNLACTYWGLGRYDEALKLQDQVLALRARVLPPYHPDTLAGIELRARILFDLGRRAEALKYHEETLALHKAHLGPDHPATLNSMCNLADNYLIDRQYSEALKHYQQALGALRAGMGPNHVTTLASLKGVAECLLELGRGAEAVAILDDWLAQAPGKIPRDSVAMASALAMLRMRHFQRQKDAAGSRASIALSESLKLQEVLAAPEGTDRASIEVWQRLRLQETLCLYNLGCMHAVTAAVIRASDNSADAASDATAEADRAMALLERAIAAGFVEAGYMDAEEIRKDEDIEALREREDFKKLMADIQERKEKEAK